MRIFKRTTPVSEREAEGEIEATYHEIKQTLRVTGINLIFRSWATHENAFPVLWSAIQPNAATLDFEHAADDLRADGVLAASQLGRLHTAEKARLKLGESQLYQIQAALDLYHYINPKLLLIAAAVRLALTGEHIGNADHTAEPSRTIGFGPPAKMYPLEMVEEESEDAPLPELFADIKQTLALDSINSDYRTLALWPDYLELAWEQLKPVVTAEPWKLAGDQLRERARELARRLPRPLRLTPERIAETGEDPGAILEMTEHFEKVLPGLILNIALLVLDWRSGEAARRSPFPVEAPEIYEFATAAI